MAIYLPESACTHVRSRPTSTVLSLSLSLSRSCFNIIPIMGRERGPVRCNFSPLVPVARIISLFHDYRFEDERGHRWLSLLLRGQSSLGRRYCPLIGIKRRAPLARFRRSFRECLFYMHRSHTRAINAREGGGYKRKKRPGADATTAAAIAPAREAGG